MTEHSILFSGPMVRAILDGRKTQTRRIVKLPHSNPLGAWEPMTFGAPNGGRTAAGDTVPLQGGIWHTRTGECLACQQGQPGAHLRVREAWRSISELDAHSGSRIAEMCIDAGYTKPWAPIQYEADGHRVNWEHTSTPPHDGEPRAGRYRHARFMPLWASRITLEITGVRVERLQSISADCARAEGIEYRDDYIAGQICRRWRCYESVDGWFPEGREIAPIHSFQTLWDSLNDERGCGWSQNPWVWVLEFRRIS
jgi:hypothetical protein